MRQNTQMRLNAQTCQYAQTHQNAQTLFECLKNVIYNYNTSLVASQTQSTLDFICESYHCQSQEEEAQMQFPVPKSCLDYLWSGSLPSLQISLEK